MTSSLALAALVAGITAFDNVHMFQWMLSRPIVIGSLIGAVMGDLGVGMLCGAWIELVWLGVLPIGNYTPPDAHITAATAATAAVLWGGSTAVCLLAVLLFIPIGILSKLVDLQLRHHLAIIAEGVLESPPPYRLSRLLPIGLIPIFVKASLTVLVSGVAAIVLAPIVDMLSSSERLVAGLEFSASLVPALGMVQLARCIGAKGRERWLLLGAVFAALVLIGVKAAL